MDHIVPAGIAVVQVQQAKLYPLDRWAGYFLRSNLQGLCRPCHHIKTEEDKSHVGEWPGVVERDRQWRASRPKKVWTF